MSLKRKLSIQSTLIFACTVALMFLGAFLLFREYVVDVYSNKLMDRARIAAYFYFEKDELNDRRYHEIEAQYHKISNEAIRVYKASTKKVFIDDGLNFQLSDDLLQRIIDAGNLSFTFGQRRVSAIYYKDNQGDFLVVVSGIDEAGKKQLYFLGWLLISLYIIGLPTHYFFTGFLSRETFRPFSSLIKKVNTISTSNLHSRIEMPSGRPDEIKELVKTFNFFLERLEKGITLQQNFLKNASHELKTPLAAIIGSIEVTLHHPRDQEEYKALLESVKNDAMHLKSLTEGLLMLSSLQIPMDKQMQEVRIDEILWNVLEKKRIELPQARIIVSLDAIAEEEDLLNVSGNRELLFVALANIIDNAVKYSIPHPVSIIADVKEGKLVLVIKDEGPGIQEQEKEAVFELFYRSNATRNISGHGIGLHLTSQILSLHHITIDIAANHPNGTIIRLSFP